MLNTKPKLLKTGLGNASKALVTFKPIGDFSPPERCCNSMKRQSLRTDLLALETSSPQESTRIEGWPTNLERTSVLFFELPFLSSKQPDLTMTRQNLVID
jgi:hypothetical protein